MIIFYYVPLDLFLGFILFLLGLGVAIAPLILYIITVLIIMGYWIINFNTKVGLIPAKVISVIGMISSFFIASALSGSISLIKSLLVILVIMSLLPTILLLITPKKIASIIYTVGIAVCLIFSLTWTIGCEMDNKTKVHYDNLAYYKCDEIKLYHTDSISAEKAENNGKPLNGVIYDITDRNIMGITDEHILGTYAEGDSITPNLEEPANKSSSMFDAYDDITWYPVVTQTGQKGYIPNTGLKLVYYDDNAFVEEKEKYFKPTTWYAFFPDSVIEACEKLYETIPLFQKIYLT